MASAYSQDLRDRVIDAVVRGGMSRRAAAGRFGASEASAIERRFRHQVGAAFRADRLAVRRQDGRLTSDVTCE